MKKFKAAFFAFCVLGALLLSLTAQASANTAEPDAGEEFREDGIELTPMEKTATELTYFIGNKIADLLDEIADSVENRAERKKSRQKSENYAEGSPNEPEDAPSGNVKSLAPGFAKIFSIMMHQVANSVREYLEENILPKLPPKDLLVKNPINSYHAVA